MNATLTLDRYADGQFARIPLNSEYVEMPILDGMRGSPCVAVALIHIKTMTRRRRREKDNDDVYLETHRVGKSIRNASPPDFVPNKSRDPKQTLHFSIQAAAKVARKYSSCRNGSSYSTCCLVSDTTSSQYSKRTCQCHDESSSTKACDSYSYQIDFFNSTRPRSRASTTSGDEKSSTDGGALSDRTYTTMSEDNDTDLDDLDTFEDADDTFDAASVNEDENSWSDIMDGMGMECCLGEDSDDSLKLS